VRPDRYQLLDQGRKLIDCFARANALPAPMVELRTVAQWPHSVCAFYRPTFIAICLPKCAPIGLAGRAWSYPGWMVDRTPYGVVAHELGHHADRERGRAEGLPCGEYYSDFGKRVHGNAGEAGITSYADAADYVEWFAECFRLFVTNPGLLQAIRPRTYRELTAAKFQPVLPLDWRALLAEAPERTRKLAERRVEEARALI